MPPGRESGTRSLLPCSHTTGLPPTPPAHTPPGAVLPPGAERPGLHRYLPGAACRRCAGDRETWRWYRGGTTAPPPCVSALLAVERWADHLLDVLKVPISAVIELMLR